MINIKRCKKCGELFDIATNYDLCSKCRINQIKTNQNKSKQYNAKKNNAKQNKPIQDKTNPNLKW